MVACFGISSCAHEENFLKAPIKCRRRSCCSPVHKSEEAQMWCVDSYKDSDFVLGALESTKLIPPLSSS